MYPLERKLDSKREESKLKQENKNTQLVVVVAAVEMKWSGEYY